MSYSPFLKHVCMWTDNKGWVPTTAKKTLKQNDGNKISSTSGLLMCDLCGHYVTLAVGKEREPHFRHSPADKNKLCDERRLTETEELDFNPRSYTLPIRIVNASSANFRFELGLIRAPIRNLSKDFYVEIVSNGSRSERFRYNKERFNLESTTYLSIGNKPYESFSLKLSDDNLDLQNIWPREIKGIDPSGSLFKANSGRMLTYDADVEVNKEYYLVKPNSIPLKTSGSIETKRICEFTSDKENWTIYLVKATKFDLDAAKFFLQYHCRLTDNPVKLQMIWPLYSRGNFIIKHNHDELHVLLSGNAQAIHSFPSAGETLVNKSTAKRKLYKIKSSGRQQLITAGRAHVLRYTYFWKEPLTQRGPTTELTVTDIQNTPVLDGESNKLPPERTLRCIAPFDGTLVIYNHGVIIKKQQLRAGSTSTVYDIGYGTKVVVRIGLDVLWQVEFVDPKDEPTARDIVRPHTKEALDELKLIQQLQVRTEPLIPAPHALLNMQAAFSHYPRLSTWVRQCIRTGVINKHSYRILQQTYRKIRAVN